MTRNITVGLFGAGGFGREVMPLLMETTKNTFINELETKTYFVTRDAHPNPINSQQNLSEDDFLKRSNKYFNIAIADYKIRKAVSEICLKNDAKPLSIFASNFLQYYGNQIAEGCIFCAHSMITSNIVIGKFFHANIYSYVGHNCSIGDYVTFAPSVQCNGNVHIGDHAYIGTGAIIREGTPQKPLVIGEGAIVGMGAVVTKDVAAYTTVVGNPARILEKRT
jgi:sugar O-acyltransferase (sialic acid O-acetyltransferase NeuD family)